MDDQLALDFGDEPIEERPAWPHQIRGVDGAREAFRQGYQSPTVVAPTGGGKTRVMEDIVLPIVEAGKRVLMPFHRRMLLTQVIDEWEEKGIPFGVIASDYPKHRDDSRGAADPLNDHRVIAAFSVPLKFTQPPGNKKQSRAHLRLALDLLASDPKGKPGGQIALPTSFPSKAPNLW